LEEGANGKKSHAQKKKKGGARIFSVEDWGDLKGEPNFQKLGGGLPGRKTI